MNEYEKINIRIGQQTLDNHRQSSYDSTQMLGFAFYLVELIRQNNLIIQELLEIKNKLSEKA